MVGDFVIVIGVMMIAMWIFFLISGQVPELETKRLEIVLHIAAEAMTGCVLILGGSLLRGNARMGKAVSTFALGMLAYTLIVSPGYYLAQKAYVVGIPFAVLLLLDFVCLYIVWKE